MLIISFKLVFIRCKSFSFIPTTFSYGIYCHEIAEMEVSKIGEKHLEIENAKNYGLIKELKVLVR